MRPVEVTLGAAGFSPWIPVNRMIPQGEFAIGLGVKLTSGASLTYSVQHTMDDLHVITQSFSISRSTTTATVTQTDHRLSVGDWILVENGGAPFDGEFAVAAITNANVYTYTVANSGATSLASGVGTLHTGRVFEHATLTGLTASANGNYAFPPWAARLYISTYSSGKATLTLLQV